MSFFTMGPESRAMPDIRSEENLRWESAWPETILSQYSASPTLLALARAFTEQISPMPQLALLYEKIFDPDTAEGWGLDVWGRIVAIDRAIKLKSVRNIFGFVFSGLTPFNQGTFYNDEATETYTLTDQAYRLLIFCKAAANITDGSLRNLNALMARLFAGRGKAMVLHVGPMKLRYVFTFALEPYERALLLREDVPPKPAGVGYELFEVPHPTFGFAGSGFQPFNQGTYIPGGPVNAYSF